MTHIPLQRRLSSNASDFSAHSDSKHKRRGLDTTKSFPNTSFKKGGSGSDDTASATHDISEEEEDSSSHRRRTQLQNERKQNGERGSSQRLSVAVTVQSTSSLPQNHQSQTSLHSSSASQRSLPTSTSLREADARLNDDHEPAESFRDESSVDSQDDPPLPSLLQGLSASVPQTPEEAAALASSAGTTAQEEEKTEDADLLSLKSLSTRGSSQRQQSATPSPAPSPASIRSSRGSQSSPPISPGTSYCSSHGSTSPGGTNSKSLRRSKLDKLPRPPPLTAQDSNDSWDMDAEDTAVVCEQAPTTTAMLTNDMDPSTRSQKSSRSQRSLTKKASLNKRTVAFSHVHIRNYNVCIGDNPFCSYGPPLSLDWDYCDDEEDIPLDIYEAHYQLPKQAQRRRCRRSLVLTYTERRAKLWRAGYSLDEIDKVAEDLEREKWRQSLLGNLEPLYRLQEFWVFYVKPVISKRARRRRELDQQLDHVEAVVREEHNSQSGDFSSGDLFVDDDEHHSGDDDLEKQQGEQESKAVLIEGIAKLIEQESQNNSPAAPPTENNTAEDTSKNNSPHKDYGIRVDKKQHDKATEIILCSVRRPHMRAFHASWFSFFVAFFSWFAIAPLLSEVQDTLGLEKADIWMSSLFATAGTIVFRILMGPACDAWGARICMSLILAASAIPTALTGLVQTSAGLSLVRLFIGLAGSSFVACQYWTSAMFSRETAGTANALVAGWGNFGGGVTNLVMGSALFPLFRWFYRGEDEDGDDSTSSELAWRTIFVIPATLSIVTAALIFFYCDDSPTGSYQDRIKAERLLVASPMESLRKSAKNWNVWILTFQYACCFGVEVTMTNATALYFKDEFGQSTVSAAGIASIFGFMNLFARGLGGFWSDKFHSMHGVKGRLFWQVLTLVLEGVGVGIFGFADSLAGSIIALIFLSCMVQSAEGSTFGIVPYVSRRYTGSVVGIVGSGGNFGAAIFAIFFVYFSYTTAFVMMGISAVASAFLSLLMKTEKLAQTHEDVALEIEQRQQLEDAEEKAQRRGDNDVAEDDQGIEPQDLEKEFMDQVEHGEPGHIEINEL